MNNKEKYVIESMGMGLRTDCFLRNAYIKRHDEDGDTWSISYDFLELAIEYDTVEEALAMAEQLYEVAPGDDVEVVTLKQAKETVSFLNDIGRRLASVSKSLAEDSGNKSLGFEDEEDKDSNCLCDNCSEESDVEYSGDLFAMKARVYDAMGLSPDDIPKEYDGMAQKVVDDTVVTARKSYQRLIDKLKKQEEDVVNHPAHYENDKYQCIDVMEDIYGTEAVMHFCMCNAFKYIWRFQKKNGIEDIQKAQWYMNKYQELGKNLTKETERC
jgi:hypothetical protein